MGILTGIPQIYLIIKQTYSYLKAQLMVSIKWGAINSQKDIGSYQERIFNKWLCFIVSRIVIKVYIIKKHNPIHTSKFKYLYYFSCILNIIHSPDSKADKVQKQNADESYWRPAGWISGLSEYLKEDILKNDSKEVKHL